MLTRLLLILLLLLNFILLELRFISISTTIMLLLIMLKRLELWIWLIDIWTTRPLSMLLDVVTLNKLTIYLNFSLRILLKVILTNYNPFGSKSVKVKSSLKRVNILELWECSSSFKRLSLIFMKINLISIPIASVSTTWIPTPISSTMKMLYTTKSLSFMAVLS